MIEGLKVKALICVVEIIENGINSIHAMGILLFALNILKKASVLVSRILCAWNGKLSSEYPRDPRSRLGIFKNMNIAFICDGNRRYARKLGLEDSFIKDKGLQKIYEFIEFGCFYGIKEISFFCFALSNFKRSPEEVNKLMGLVKQKIERPKEIGIGPKFRVYGRLDLLEEDVRKRLMDIEEESKNNTSIIVNIFFAYSAEDEITRGIQFNSHVDILIRTSNTKRLSNFMIRQVAKGTSVFFAKALWPELTTAHLFLILLKHRLENKYLLG
uniref:Undecaprenyl pyrophosphate synthetase n=1 Tax=Encephalitozoon cuniculi TaxID=6035 RepID=M1KAT3_ENCCN|nr:undecaprenyl pyrophosphate synthetase [Encephalitozoon cuniculi]